MSRELPSSVAQITDICGVHQEKLDAYCKSHEIPCCRKCIHDNHKKCKDIIKLSDAARSATYSEFFSEIQLQLEDVQKNVQSVKENRQTNANKLTEQRQRIEDEIREMRKKVNDYFEQLQNKILAELSQVESKSNEKLKSLIRSLSDKEKEVIELQNNMSDLKAIASDLQTFLGVKETEPKAAKIEYYLQTLTEGDSLHDVNLSFEANNVLQIIEKNVKSFGEISVKVDDKRTVNLERRKTKQAQIFVDPTSKSIDNIHLKLIKKI